MTIREVNAFLRYIKAPYRIDHHIEADKELSPVKPFSLATGESRMFEVGEGDNRLYIIVKHHPNGEYSIAGK